jgi:hypothetical protein
MATIKRQLHRPRDLIVFGEDWGGLPSSTQHLMHHLSTSRKILWVNSIGLRRPKPSWRDLKRAWTKFTSAGLAKSAREKHRPNKQFHIINPFTLPAPRTWIERKLATQLLVSQIRPKIKKAKLSDPILWTSLPTAVDVSGQLDESALVYYCGDDFSALAGVDHNTIKQRECL